MIKFNIRNKKLKSNRNIILCTSSLSIPFTITLIEKFKETSTIITQSKEIFKFLVKFYPKLDIIFVEQLRSYTNKNPIKMIKNNYYNYLLKKKLNFLFSKYSNSNVFTVIRAFSPLSGYILLVLSKKNKIYHQRIVKSNWKKKKSNLKFRILKIYNKIVLGIDVDIAKGNDNRYLLPYSKKFFEKIGAKTIKYKINPNLIKKFSKKKLNIYNNKILLLCSGYLLEHGSIDKKLFFEFMKQWSLTNNFKKILLKKKNSSEKKKYIEKTLFEVPSYIPANLLIYNFKIVIGIYSATLFEAANKSCKAISLLYILSKDAKTINYCENYLNKNLQRNKKIFYPKTYEQFIKYLNADSI